MSIPVDSRTRALWLFAEQYDSVRPSDETGNLDALTEGTEGNTLPAVVDGTITGFGREFVASDETGLEVEDADDDLRMSRDVSILAVLRLDVIDQDAAGYPATIIQRGTGAAADYVPFGMRLEVTNVLTNEVKLSLFWQDEAGVFVEDGGVTFNWEDDAFYFLAAVRETVDGELVCRYRYNDIAATGDTNDLDVGSASGQTIYVGAGRDDADYQEWFDGTLCGLEVLGEAISGEELRWLWERMSQDMPSMVSAIRRLVPPDVYSQDPDSIVQRELANEGRLLGLIKSGVRRLRDYSLPDRAWGSYLERWEAVTGHSPKAGDWLARRRARVASFLAADLGFHRDSIKDRLEELFDLDAADIELLEYSNTQRYDFATDPGGYIAGEGNAALVVGAGEVNFQATGQKLALNGTNVETGAAGWLLFSVPESEDAVFGALISSVTGDPNACGGLLVGDRGIDSWLVVAQNADVPQALSYMFTAHGAPTGAPVVLDANPGAPLFVLLRYIGGGEYEVSWGTDEADAAAATPTTISGAPEPFWMGFVATTEDDNTADIDASFTDLLIHTPRSRERFHWYAYRDPILAGEYDIEGAHLLVQRIKPAHTHATAVTVQQIVCDSSDSLCGYGPLGLGDPPDL